uniref:DM2 domain-containing protein n=1 Tax=Kalanchoe fedtschenkoi TaxID=63787 RepID=A0A7N0UGV2_KALFE
MKKQTLWGTREQSSSRVATTMASDQEIAAAVESVLRQLDPNAGNTFNDVVSQLEAKLGHSLAHKTGFIRDHINFLLRPQPPPPPRSHQHFDFQRQHSHYQPQQFQNGGPSPGFNPQFHVQPFRQDLNFESPVASAPPLQLQQRVPEAFKDAGLAGNVEQGAIEKQSVPAATKRKGGPGGLSKVCGVTPELQAVVGQPALPRTEIVKQLWAYIRKNNLQDPSNKRKIICDDALRIVFETDCTDMFKMNKLLSKHIIPLEQSKVSSHAKRVRVEAEPVSEDVKTGSSQLRLSEGLVRFLGTEEKYMTQAEAMQRVWDYIKINQLEDPSNPMAVLCDSKLQDLIGCPSISALGISEMIKSRHLLHQ